MPLFDPEDLDELADALGKADVTIDGVTVKGFFDPTDEEALAGEGTSSMGEVSKVRVRTGSLPGLGVGVACIVDGDSYSVRQYMRITDGLWTLIFLDTAYRP